MQSVDDFQAVCEAAANLLNTARIPQRGAAIKSRLLECRDQLDRELQREGFRLPETHT